MVTILCIGLLSFIGYDPLSSDLYQVNVLPEGVGYTDENTIYHHLDNPQYSAYQGTPHFEDSKETSGTIC